MHRVAASCVIAGLSAAVTASAQAQPPRLLGPPVKLDRVDYSCDVDADCAIKDIGNCLGVNLTCVNRDSPTFADRVREECKQQQHVGGGGGLVVQGCTCVEVRCSNREQGATSR